ncbi:MAG: hypothetical protein JKX72_09530 [Robiginitomaculum sp.]|nr:hypothetical protein [Robiginitomaculum sp.]
MVDNPIERRKKLREAIIVAAKNTDFSLTPQAVDAIVDRAYGHVEARVITESRRDLDISEAVISASRLVGNLRRFKPSGTFYSNDFADFIAKSTNCFYPWCKPN